MARKNQDSEGVENAVSIANIAKDLAYTRIDVAEIKNTLHSGYVTNDRFAPVEKLVYGMVTLILLAVVGALVKLVIIK